MSGGLWGLCSVINKLVSVVVSHDHVHHSLHKGLEDIVIEVLDWLNEGLECLAKSKSWKYSKLRQRLHIVGGEYDH